VLCARVCLFWGGHPGVELLGHVVSYGLDDCHSNVHVLSQVSLREMVEPLGGKALWRVERSLETCPQRGL
jgi:hypothetical protein